MEPAHASLPEAARYFEPGKKEVWLTVEKKRPQRLIFSQQEFDSFERDNLRLFNEYCAKNNINIPPWFDTEEHRNIMRYFQGCDWSVEKTVTKILEHIKWRETYYPINIEEVLPVLNMGIVYMTGYDTKYRPILIINIERLVQSKLEIEFVTRALVYLLDLCINKVFIPGKIENWNVIIDANNVGLTSLPVSALKNMIGAMQSNYRARLYKLFAVNVSFVLSTGFKVLKPFIDPFTLEKIDISRNINDKMYSCINKTQLEKKYGGTRENMVTDFFPPKF